jgi:uncharacterized OB-fold protein
MELRNPDLYAPAGADDRAVLLAMRCRETGVLAFPRTSYGIGASGAPAERTEPVTLNGCGEVLVCVTVHQPLSPGMVTPLLVARLRLEEGIVLDGIIDGTDEAAVSPGTRVQAVLVPEEREGRSQLVCRFRPLREGMA